MKNKLPAILAVVTTIFGLISSPLFMKLIPAEWSAVIIAAGSLWQAVTKAIQHK